MKEAVQFIAARPLCLVILLVGLRNLTVFSFYRTVV
jgi:hypothetical protein